MPLRGAVGVVGDGAVDIHQFITTGLDTTTGTTTTITVGMVVVGVGVAVGGDSTMWAIAVSQSARVPPKKIRSVNHEIYENNTFY